MPEPIRRVRLIPDAAERAPVRRVPLDQWPAGEGPTPAREVRRAPARLEAARARSVLVAAVQDARRRWEEAAAAERDDEGGASGESDPAERAGESFLAGLLARLRPRPQALLRQLRWPLPLYPFQAQGVAFLYGHRGALLADDMGLGKSCQALGALQLLFVSRQVGDALIVCPASLLAHWSAQIALWLPQLAAAHEVVRGAPRERHARWRSAAPLKVVSYETLRADWEGGRMPQSAFGVVVLDEAQRIKNAESGTARCCKALRRVRSWALTGTPLENRLEDLGSILEFVTAEQALHLEAGPRLRERQRHLQLRRRKEDVCDQLPPKTVVDVALELAPAQRETYDELERDGILRLRELGSAVRVTHVLALIARLKQICNFCPRTGESSKLAFLREQLAEVLANDRRALVFSQYAGGASGIRRLRAELGPAVGLFHGGMSLPEKELALRLFKQGETPVLALSLKAGGVGLNLQEASYVFHFDRWWNPAVERQAEDRAHRIGQSLPVTVYRLFTPGTIEERICALLDQKTALFAQVVDGAPVEALPALMMTELAGLLDLEIPEAER